jgi:hypothetical protein
MSDDLGQLRSSADVRNASDSDRIAAMQLIVAMGHIQTFTF